MCLAKVLSAHVSSPFDIPWQRQVELLNERVVGVQDGRFWTSVAKTFVLWMVFLNLVFETFF